MCRVYLYLNLLIEKINGEFIPDIFRTDSPFSREQINTILKNYPPKLLR